MKNKPLLNESTVRKFMKLANLGRVGQGFIAENYGAEEEEEGELEEVKLDTKVADPKMKKEFPHKKGHKPKNVTGPKVHEGSEEEEEGELEESLAKQGGNKYNAFKGMTKHQNKPAKSSKKVMQEADEEEEEADVDMPPADADAGAESPDMGAAPDMEPAEEPTEMDASDLADKIINVLKDAGLVDVVEDDESGVELDKEPEGEEDEDEEEDDESMYDEEEEEDENLYMQERKKKVKREEEEEEDDEGKMNESKKRQLAKLVAERVQARLAREARIESLAESITKRVMARAKATR